MLHGYNWYIFIRDIYFGRYKVTCWIRKLVENKSNLLDSIGATQMSQSLEREVLDVYNTLTYKMHNDIGVTPSLSPEEAKNIVMKLLRKLEISKESINSQW